LLARRIELPHAVAERCEGGDDGGLIVAEGTPEEVAKDDSSYTGQFLQRVFKKSA